MDKNKYDINKNGKIDVFREYEADNKAYQSDGNLENAVKPTDKPEEEKIIPVSIAKLFSFTTCCDKIFIFIGLFAALCSGVAWPAFSLVFGDSTDSLTGFEYYIKNLTKILVANNVTIPANADLAKIIELMKTVNPGFKLDDKYNISIQMEWMARYLAIVALGMLITSYFSQAFLVITSQRQAAEIRKAYFRAIMRQNIEWFDSQSSGELHNKLVDDVNSIMEGIGDKLGQMVMWLAVGVVGLIIAFIKGWKLSLVVLAVSPLIGVVTFLMIKMMATLNQSELIAYGKAGAIAEEVLGAIRTVVAFKGEKYELERYTSNLDDASISGTKKGALMGLMMGLFNCLMFLSYALGFWYGGELIRAEELLTGAMLTIFFCCMMASMGFGQAMPFLGTLMKARYAAASIFQVIDRVPEIDKMTESGKKMTNLVGKIQFRNVAFSYPTRKTNPVLTNLDIDIASGETIALVGSSGCGKSSIIQLIQRFYDVDSGEILIDGEDIQKYNVMSLRNQIGVVSQEPVLFGCSIRENIKYGRMDVTEEQIQDAIKMANAKTFIDNLPDGLETEVGDRGAQLSGGQKQRIAIARALVRNPRLLLLDEATSALDTESETIVQEALDKAREGRTTVVVAHRLSTVRDANRIFGIREGKVIESGSHEELIKLEGGLYKELVQQQTVKDQDPVEVELSKELEKEENLIKSGELRNRTSSVNPKDVEVKTANTQSVFSRVLKLNSPESCFIFLGCVGAMLNGASQPGFAVLFGYAIPAMANTDKVQQEKDLNLYVILMVVVAVVTFIANLMQSYFFAKSGELLTKRCRHLSLKAMLRQDITWFDEPDNSLGALTSRLSSEASAIRGTSGENLGIAFQAIFSMGTGIIIAFIYSWQISLLLIGFVPILLIGGYLQIKVMSGGTDVDKKSLENAGKVSLESIENIRTVTSLTREYTLLDKYDHLTDERVENISKKAHFQAILYGFTQATIFCGYAATFMLAGYLLNKQEISLEDVFIPFGAIMFGAMYLGNAMAMAPNYSKGKVAAEKMFEIMDRKPAIDSYMDDGLELRSESLKGQVDINSVYFSYPLRPASLILRGLTIDIEPNTTIALVGSSGCGKSTVMQLLQRFYSYRKGYIKIDNKSINEIKTQDIRECVGIVSQEPILFSCSVRENIAYADTAGRFTNANVEEVAKSANIHDFIMTLPQGYDTKINEKGSNLSGGQKQRIAIARALLKNPRILLLDEATSALDTESEKIVQDALDKAQEGRTNLVIAHRLSTIQNADKIVVLKDGRIVEQGSHAELISKPGLYYKMVMQSQNKK